MEQKPKPPFWKRYKKLIIAAAVTVAAVNLMSLVRNMVANSAVSAELTGMPAKPQQEIGVPSNRATRPPSRVEVSTAQELKDALGGQGDLEILLTADIDEYDNSDDSAWCRTASGRKLLDLNGHGVVIRNEWTRRSTLLLIGVGTELVIWDSREGGSVTYDAYLDEQGTLRTRDLFEVCGRLVVNGGSLTAGRTKKSYNQELARQTRKQIQGSAIRVRDGGTLIVNGGCLTGRGWGENAISAEDGATVWLNDGIVRGSGQAQCIDGSVRVASGQFGVEPSEQIQQDGMQSLTPARDVGIGISADMLAERSVHGAVDPNAKELTVSVGVGRCELAAESGDTVLTEDGRLLLRIMNELPFVSVVPEEPYFGGLEDTDYPGVEYRRTYQWQVLYDGRVVSETKQTENLTRINLMSAFPGFTPALGEQYIVRCRAVERLKPGLEYERLQVDTPFVLTQTEKAPFLTNDLPDVLYFKPGDEKTLHVAAVGTRLKYQWQQQLADGTWTELEGAAAPGLTLELLTEDDAGRRFRCRVSNSEGTIYSSAGELALLKEEIDYLSFTGIRPPVHGELLDRTAETLTKGCTVTEVSWRTLGKDEAGVGFRPCAGMKMVVSVTVKREQETVYAKKLDGDLDGLEWMDWTTRDDPNCTFEFCLTTEPPEEPEAIAMLRLSCAEPESGEVCGSVGVVNMGYDDGSCEDLRYTALGSTQWAQDGEPMELMKDCFESDHVYTVNNLLQANEGWIFTDATIAELNGEQMDAQLLSDGTLACSFRYDISRQKAEQEELFLDVSESDYFYEAVLWAISHDPQITTGTDSRHFSPDDNCTRAQVITFLWRALCCPQAENGADLFADVSGEEYYDRAVRWAVENNVTVGATVEAFGPDKACTRAEVIAFLWRALDKPALRAAVNPFTDLSPGQYYYSAVLWALEHEITTGSSSSLFRPEELCTRAQVVTFLYRAMKERPELTGQPEDLAVPAGGSVRLQTSCEGGNGECECIWQEYLPDGTWITRVRLRSQDSFFSWNFRPERTTVLRPVIQDRTGLQVTGRPFAVSVSGRPAVWQKPLRLLIGLPSQDLQLPDDGKALMIRCAAEGGSACYDYTWYRSEDDAEEALDLSRFTYDGSGRFSSDGLACITLPGTYYCVIRDRLTAERVTTERICVR